MSNLRFALLMLIFAVDIIAHVKWRPAIGSLSVTIERPSCDAPEPRQLYEAKWSAL